MAITIRPGDLHTDRDVAVSLFARHLNPDYDSARFEWLYVANPAGAGRLWIATDDRTGEVIGTAGAFPRDIYLEGREVGGWVLGDFCVAEAYRALGPALTLQRVCLADLAATPAALFYDFPHRRLMPIYARLRVGPPRLMRRLARPLRVDDKVRERVKPSILARGLSAAANSVLARGARSPRASDGMSIGILDGPCGPEFSTLERKVSADYGTCLRRSAEYLNWRYVRNPVQGHEIVTVHQDDRLVAWAVVALRGETGTLVDVFGVPDGAIVGTAVQAAVARLSRLGCARVSVSIFDASPWVEIFRRLGFSPRETSPVILHPLPGAGLSVQALDSAPLFLMQGDQDS